MERCLSDLNIVSMLTCEAGVEGAVDINPECTSSVTPSSRGGGHGKSAGGATSSNSYSREAALDNYTGLTSGQHHRRWDNVKPISTLEALKKLI